MASASIKVRSGGGLIAPWGAPLVGRVCDSASSCCASRCPVSAQAGGVPSPATQRPLHLLFFNSHPAADICCTNADCPCPVATGAAFAAARCDSCCQQYLCCNIDGQRKCIPPNDTNCSACGKGVSVDTERYDSGMSPVIISWDCSAGTDCCVESAGLDLPQRWHSDWRRSACMHWNVAVDRILVNCRSHCCSAPRARRAISTLVSHNSRSRERSQPPYLHNLRMKLRTYGPVGFLFPSLLKLPMVLAAQLCARTHICVALALDSPS